VCVCVCVCVCGCVCVHVCVSNVQIIVVVGLPILFSAHVTHFDADIVIAEC